MELTEDGTGGHTPSFTGVDVWLTSDGSAPTWDTTAGTSTILVFLSRDGGTTIIGGVMGAGDSVSGSAGGDLSGTYPDPTVAKVNGVTVDPTGGSTGDVLTQQSDGSFAPETPSASSGAHYLVIASSHSTPLVFDDIVQNSDGDDLVYTS